MDREPRHAFSGGQLDRAAHLREDPDALTALLHSHAGRYLPFRELDPLLAGTERLQPAWLERSRVERDLQAGADVVFLGLDADAPRFAVDVTSPAVDEVTGPSPVAFSGLRAAAARLAEPDASTVALARSMLAWLASHRFCPRCGSPSAPTHGGHQVRCTNPECGGAQFPRTDPVVIMLIHREDSCLVGRAVRARRYPPGLYSCLAGYVEPGESIEEAVRRESLEEAGLRVGRVRYHSSQPWPFPSQLMIGCFAEALHADFEIDPAELEEARWLTREELGRALESWEDPAALRLPPPLTIAHQLSRAWLAGSLH